MGRERVKDSQKLWVKVREMQQLHKTGEIVRESEHQEEKVRDMQQLHGTGRDKEKHQAKMGVSEGHDETQWNKRDS